MLPFFQKNKTPLEIAVDEKGVLPQKLSNLKNKTIKTDLFIPSSYTISKEYYYILQFLNNELTPMTVNHLDVCGISLKQTPYLIEVRAFFRNTLSDPFKVKNIKLELTTNDKEIIAEHSFDLSYLGIIKPQKSIYVIIHFPSESIKLQQFDLNNFSIYIDTIEKSYE